MKSLLRKGHTTDDHNGLRVRTIVTRVHESQNRNLLNFFIINQAIKNKLFCGNQTRVVQVV